MRWPWLGLVVIGLVGGSLTDHVPEKESIERGGYRVLLADFHVHTRFSDGFLSPFETVYEARRHGLDAFALTEHNNVFPGHMAQWFSERIDGPTVIVGEEITTDRYHLIGVGLYESIDPTPNVRGALDRIHEQGGVAIAAHPARHYWEVYEPVLADLDAAEVVHPIALRKRRGSSWRWEDMVTFYEDARADGHEITAIGSSDFHFFGILGVCHTLVFVDSDDEDAVIAALREGRTVVIAPDGRRFGDPALIDALDSDPLPDGWLFDPPGYDSTGAVDAVTRTLGFIGLLGLVLVRVPRRKK